MRFGSVCSGIETASVAWEPLGFTPAWFSEIAPWPSKFLSTRYPSVPNHGSLVGLADRLAGDDRRIDLLVGGTPCQAFSVSGLRGGLTDERGNLTLEFARLAAALRPRWVLWENVPGVLSDDTNAFGCLLGALCELGYGLAWRVLDAQFFGVAQRRQRVFLVGHLGAAAAAGAVLFEPEGVRRNPPPRRASGEDVAGTPGSGTGGFGGDLDRCGAFVPEVANTVKTQDRRVDVTHGTFFVQQEGPEVGRCLTTSAQRLDSETETETFITASFDETQVTSPGNRSSCDPSTAALTKSGRPPSIAFNARQDPVHSEHTTGALDTAGNSQAVCVTGTVTHALRSVGADASEDGTGRGTLIVPVTVALRGREGGATAELGGEVANALRAANGGGSAPYALTTRVRRLTPRECERLQGFPDVKKRVTIRVCRSSENLLSGAPAEQPSHKSPSNALPVEGDVSVRCATGVGLGSSSSHQDPDEPARLRVLIDCERVEVRVLSRGRLLWSASIADGPGASRLPMPIEDFVRLAALTTRTAGQLTRVGEEASQQRTTRSTRPLSGSGCVSVSGRAIDGLVRDVELLMRTARRLITSTTSEAEPNSQTSDSTLTTLCSCVAAAIASFTQDATQSESSFDFEVECVEGWTAINGAKDSPRYAALGNSMAVPVISWLGERIAKVDALLRELEAA